MASIVKLLIFVS